jgi:tyrosine-protein phosphatase YwqE
MVDIHCHLVPGVDDGAVSLEMSLAMIEAAKQCGVTSILTTPHIRGAAEDAVVHEMHKKAFQKVLDAKPDMDLHLGGEVRVTPETHGITNPPARNRNISYSRWNSIRFHPISRNYYSIFGYKASRPLSRIRSATPAC